MGIIFEDLLGIVARARGNFEIADDGRRVPRTKSKGEWREGIQRFENVALPVDDGAAKCRVEKMLLGEAPGNEFLRSVITFFVVEALGEAVFDLVCICERGIRVEPVEIEKIVYSRHIF